MPLDLHIFGAGTGEMILLRWDEGGSSHAALIDCYVDTARVERLKEEFRLRHVTEFSFIAVTHPHLDHLMNLHNVLKVYPKMVGRFWLWPGRDWISQMAYFERVAACYPNEPHDLKGRAKAVSEMFRELDHQFFTHGKPEVQHLPKLRRIYPVGGPGGEMEVTCVSPWPEAIRRFESLVEAAFNDPEVTYAPREANLVSGGFLIKYGKSQILLGGDMEEENWLALRGAPDCPEIRPCVVKVSHHGSSTGQVSEMWGPDGFLGRHQPIAVITPWRNGELPEQGVIDDIKSSGCATYVTGRQRYRVREVLSEIHICVDGGGRRPRVVSTSKSVERV